MYIKNLKISLFLPLLLLLLLSSCGLNKGYVLAKQFIPSHWTSTLVPITNIDCEGSGSNRVCDTYTTLQNTFTWYADDWELTLSTCSTDIPEQSKNNCDVETVSVTESDYERATLYHYIQLSQ